MKNGFQDDMPRKNCFMPVKSPPRWPKKPPRRSKTVSGRPQDALRRPRPPPRQPRGAPKIAQDAPKTPPRRLQDAPKTTQPRPRRPKMFPRRARMAPRRLKTPPDLGLGTILVKCWLDFGWFCNRFWKVLDAQGPTRPSKSSQTEPDPLNSAIFWNLFLEPS